LRRILLLLDDSRIDRGASSETAFDKKIAQLDQRAHRHARSANRHASTRDRIQHPGGYRNDDAGRSLNVNTLTAATPLAVLLPDPPPMQRMPTVMDLDLLPDMGRMTGRLL
jgi:hypothetical protein